MLMILPVYTDKSKLSINMFYIIKCMFYVHLQVAPLQNNVLLIKQITDLLYRFIFFQWNITNENHR